MSTSIWKEEKQLQRDSLEWEKINKGMTDLEQEILSRHPDWEQEEQEKRDREAEADMDRFWEIGSDHPERRKT